MASQMLSLEQRGLLSTSLYVVPLVTGLLWIAYRLGPRNSNIAKTDYAARADRVLKSTPLIDGHNDLPYLLRIELQNQINGGKLAFREGKEKSHLPVQSSERNPNSEEDYIY